MKLETVSRRLEALEAQAGANVRGDDVKRRLKLYEKYFAGEPVDEPMTEEEKANLTRYERYFNEL